MFWQVIIVEKTTLFIQQTQKTCMICGDLNPYPYPIYLSFFFRDILED